MVNKNELLYVVDEYDNKLKPRPRHEVFKNGYWRRTVHIWIINGKKQLLVQKRSAKKDMSPGKWEPAVTGHIGPKDTYFTGAVREVKEETGLPIKVDDLNLVKIYKDYETHEYRAIFYCKVDVQLSHIKIEEEEVDEVKFLKPQTLRKYFLYKESESWIRHDYEREMFSILK